MGHDPHLFFRKGNHMQRMESQTTSQTAYQHNLYPDTKGRFGAFGGKFVPESLMAALAELEQAYEASLHDGAFQEELQKELHSYVGRPTTLHYVPRLSAAVDPDVQVYLT